VLASFFVLGSSFFVLGSPFRSLFQTRAIRRFKSASGDGAGGAPVLDTQEKAV
jgi:hypothetical protein